MKLLPALSFLAMCGITLAQAENVLPSPTSEAVLRPVVDLSAPDAEKQAASSHPQQVTVARAADGKGIDVAVAAGPAGFPGVNFIPEGAGYDLSGTGFVEAAVTNTGTQIISVSVRVDSSDNNSSSGVAYLKPGESGKARAYFASPGKSSGPVDAAKVSKVLVFIGKNETVDRSFRLNSLLAGGRPGDQAPTNPDLVRNKPKNGEILGGNVPFDAAKQIVARGGSKAAPVSDQSGKAVAMDFAGKSDQSVLLRPVRGFWDLGEYLQVAVKVKNTGPAPASLTAQLTSRGGVSDLGVPAKAIAPGETVDVVIPFIPREPFEIISVPEQNVLEGKKAWGVKETPGARFTSHQTTGLLLTPAAGAEPASFEILGVKAGMPELKTPEWLGQKPPVEGEWVKTFEDNFDGDKIDAKVWNTYSENHWDKRVGFSKDNVLLGEGLARLRIEKRAGHHNDDPAQRATEFATGWLDTYGKWSQKYGYYEVRVKLPTAPSMFPAFWLMPERGPAEWPKYRRTDTKDGGMEFDVFEGQSMWGPYRTTFGAHWDSYVKYHKSAGTSFHYNPPDKDGFLTIGMLWLPGHVSVYSQGRKGGSWDSERIATVPSYLIFDMLPGGFEYDPLDPKSLPADLVVDYVRVWQRKDLVEPAAAQVAEGKK